MVRFRNTDGNRIRNAEGGARKHCCCDVTCDFTYEEIACATFTFTYTGEGGTVFLWDFGDGYTSTLENPTHTFWGDDTFTVTLTVDETEECSQLVEFVCETNCERFQAFLSTITSVTLETVSTVQTGDCIDCIEGRSYSLSAYNDPAYPSLTSHPLWDGVNPQNIGGFVEVPAWFFAQRDTTGFNCNGYEWEGSVGDFRTTGVALSGNGEAPFFQAESAIAYTPFNSRHCSMVADNESLGYEDFTLGVTYTSTGDDIISVTVN